jgi:hypothetical protein
LTLVRAPRSSSCVRPITDCIANVYEDEESRIGSHSDSADGIVPQTSTSLIFLGGERNLTFRSKHPQRRKINVRLQHGSLLVMRAPVQELWTHALLPKRGAAPRISLTFRFVARAPAAGSKCAELLLNSYAEGLIGQTAGRAKMTRAKVEVSKGPSAGFLEEGTSHLVCGIRLRRNQQKVSALDGPVVRCEVRLFKRLYD